jgi:hypothetical protein
MDYILINRSMNLSGHPVHAFGTLISGGGTALADLAARAIAIRLASFSPRLLGSCQLLKFSKFAAQPSDALYCRCVHCVAHLGGRLPERAYDKEDSQPCR